MIKLDKNKTALLIIDMQKDFYGPDGQAVSMGKKVEKMQSLSKPISKFASELRKLKIPIFFSKFISDESITPKNLKEVAKENKYSLSCLINSGGEDFEGMEIKEGDIIIKKPHFDTFAYTNLLKKLKSRSIENILICGVRTEICVDATAKRAASEGFRTIILSDLVGTYDDKQELNNLILKLFQKYYGYSLESSQVLKCLK